MDSALSIAIEALSLVEQRHLSGQAAVSRATQRLNAHDERAISEATRLVRNVIQRKNFLDKLLTTVTAPASLHDLTVRNQAFLRIFTFEIVCRRKSVEEAVAFARSSRAILGWERLKPVEETLGKIIRIDRQAVFAGLEADERLGLQTFYPDWFVRYCIRLFGRKIAVDLLRYSKPQPTFVRINSLKGTEADIVKELAKSGVVLEKVEALPHIYRTVRERSKLAQLPANEQNLFAFQGKASCLAALIGDPQPGYLVYELGIRPAATTLYLAQLMANTGKIIAADMSAHRIDQLTRAANKASAKNLETLLMTAQTPSLFQEKADLVLLSPECSGTGLFWREPSLKWSVDFAAVEEAATTQWTLIDKAANYVKAGGNLVYWTNSITLEENELIIERFLKLHPEFTLQEVRPRLGMSALRGQAECQRLYPHLHEADGSFFAKLHLPN